VGTEQGLLVTYDAGRSWKRVTGNLPPVPIDDIVVHPRTRDVVLGTHGRSVILLDDARFLADGDPAAVKSVRLLPPAPATAAYAQRSLPSAGAGKFAGENPPAGVVITYLIPGAATAVRADSVSLKITGTDGAVIRELRGPGGPGTHRVAWDLRHGLPYTPVADDAVWFGPPKGAWVLPGTYTVALSGPGVSQQQVSVEVRGHPRITVSRADLEARHNAGLHAQELLRVWADADAALRRAEAQLSGQPSNDSVAAVQLRRVRGMKERFRSGWGSLKSRILDVHGAVQSATAAPTEAQARTLGALSAELKREVAALNVILAAAGIAPVTGPR
jgi:hypothetical protein